MTGWGDLAALGLTVRPWSGSLPARGYAYSRFRAPMGKTMRLLARELEHLDAKGIVIELDIRDRDIRLDGLPRADARPVGHPCVAVSFESRHGPLRYMTGEYEDWGDNLRAVALSLEALRAVDRYGVSRRGEQYRGWRALEAGDGSQGMYSAADARDYLMRHYGREEDRERPTDAAVAAALRRGLFVTHPDRDGNVNEFYRVIRAKELLDAT